MPNNPPAKPTRDFPLWAHKSGSWCAVIDGQRKTFGGWARDRDGSAALGRYNAYMEARALGKLPDLATGRVVVRDVVNHYLTRQLKRAAADEITLRNLRDVRTAVESFAEAVGKLTPVANLRPATFSLVRTQLGKYAPATIRRHIAHIKAMFKWAYDHELIAAPPRYGSDFKAPAPRPRDTPLVFSADEVVTLIDTAPVPLRAMIRLGIECGFGQTDVSNLKWAELDLEAGRYAGRRPKTGAHRRCVLSADLVADLKEWREKRERYTTKGSHPEHVFITKRGELYVREIAGDKPTDPVRVVDSVATLFDKHARYRASIKQSSDGRGFYTLRRTHRTWSDELRDDRAADLVMGHTVKDMGGRYVQEIGWGRLEAISGHIMLKLEVARRTQSPQPPAPADGSAAGADAGGAERKRRGRRGRFARSSARSRR